MTRAFRMAGVALVAVAGAAGVAAGVSSCAPTPTNVPVRSFQGARNVDYLCVAINTPDGGATLPPSQNVGLPPDECPQVPPNVNGVPFANHLVALVTQSTRGEVAAVDLTAGTIIDEARDIPGINFIPVGSSPTGIVVGPDHQMTFVSSAATNQPAIYGIPTAPTTRGGLTLAGVLGDYLGNQCEPGQQSPCPAPAPLQLTDLPACALPAPPQTVTVARLPPGTPGPAAGYVVVAVLQGRSPSIVTIDPTPFLKAAGASVAGAEAGADGGAEAGATGTALTPGVLSACPILGAVRVSGVPSMPDFSPGPAWPDGVPYADAGSLASQEPGPGPCATPVDDGGAPQGASLADAAALSVTGPAPAYGVMRDDFPIYYVGDARLPLIHVFDFADPVRPVELAPLVASSVVQPGRVVSVGQIAISPPTRNYQRFLYAVDATEGSIIVYDVTDPVASPHVPLQRPHAELNPLAPSDRILFSAPVASLVFAQHDWPLLPQVPGSATNPDQVHVSTGILCNPNPNAHPNATTFLDPGAYYRVDVQEVQSPSVPPQSFPQRLRGIFGFATLTNGQIVTIDVDDWDAPCRRPDPMAVQSDAGSGTMGPFTGMTGLLALPQPDAGPDGSLLDPYAAPFTEPQGGLMTPATTQEAFFPVSAPNRTRSNYLLRNDPTSGNHAPNLVGAPALSDENGAPVSTVAGSVGPLILPTQLPPGFIDPSLVSDPTDPPYQQKILVDASVVPGPGSPAPGVRLSFEDPTVSSDQDWSVTYEGVLPSVNPIAADMQPIQPGSDAGAFQTLTLTIGQQIPNSSVPEAGFPAAGPGFCERGVEDWDIGQARAKQALAAMAAAGLPQPPSLTEWTSDYVELTEDLLAQGDTYWNSPQACWDGLMEGKTPLASKGGSIDPQSLADTRYNACFQAFGTAATADTNLARDLPILKAYDDHLVVGRFYWPMDPETTKNRVIVGPDPGNEKSLKFVACCFHNQAQFKVRTGGEWLAAGQSSGLLHHVVTAPLATDPMTGATGRRCVLSCDPNDVLLNARSFDVPWANIPWGTGGVAADGGMLAEAGADGGHPPATVECSPSPMAIGRTNPLAMQNPYFSYVTWMGCGVPSTPFDHTLTPRGYMWKVQVRGGFSPLVMSLTGGTLASISPQSMIYIQPFGQLAVVDGESQGLVLIDLSSLQFAHAPYF